MTTTASINFNSNHNYHHHHQLYQPYQPRDNNKSISAIHYQKKMNHQEVEDNEDNTFLQGGAGIEQPHINDVLYGRGGATNNHRGNILWRALVDANKEAYVQRSTRDKTLTSQSIVLAIRLNQDPPGRFLKQDPDTKLWYDVGDREAQRKTSQALREGNSVSSMSSRLATTTNNNKAGKNDKNSALPFPSITASSPFTKSPRGSPQPPPREVDFEPPYDAVAPPPPPLVATESDSLEYIYRSGMQIMSRQQQQQQQVQPPLAVPSDSLLEIFANAMEADVNNNVNNNNKVGLRVTVDDYDSYSSNNDPVIVASSQQKKPTSPPQQPPRQQLVAANNNSRPITSNRSMDITMNSRNDDDEDDDEDSTLSHMFQSMMSLMSVATSVGTFDYDPASSSRTFSMASESNRTFQQWESSNSVMGGTGTGGRRSSANTPPPPPTPSATPYDWRVITEEDATEGSGSVGMEDEEEANAAVAAASTTTTAASTTAAFDAAFDGKY